MQQLRLFLPDVPFWIRLSQESGSIWESLLLSWRLENEFWFNIKSVGLATSCGKFPKHKKSVQKVLSGHNHAIGPLKWQPKVTWKPRLQGNRNYRPFRSSSFTERTDQRSRKKAAQGKTELLYDDVYVLVKPGCPCSNWFPCIFITPSSLHT